MAIESGELREHRVRNFLQTTVIMVGIALLGAAIGWSIAGTTGLVLFALGAVFFLVIGRRAGPRLVLRMYKAKPLDQQSAPGLVAMVDDLAERARLPKAPTLFYVPTEVLNAFAVGTRRQSGIGITDGLLRALDERQLRGVLAHEVTHVARNDTTVMGLADLVSRAAYTISNLGKMMLFLNFPLLMFSGDGGIPWPLIFLLLFAPMLAGLLQMALSRTREYDADLGAAKLTGDPLALASALRTMERTQRGGGFEQIFMPNRRTKQPSLLRTHPQTEERVRRLYDVAGEPYEPPPPQPSRRSPGGPFGSWPVPRGPRFHWASGVYF